MSCYAKHPEIVGIECWHGPGHAGDHNKENYSWPNADDKYQKTIARLLARVAELEARRLECPGCLALLARAADMLAEVQEEPDGLCEWQGDLLKHRAPAPTGSGK